MIYIIIVIVIHIHAHSYGFMQIDIHCAFNHLHTVYIRIRHHPILPHMTSQHNRFALHCTHQQVHAYKYHIDQVFDRSSHGNNKDTSNKNWKKNTCQPFEPLKGTTVFDYRCRSGSNTCFSQNQMVRTDLYLSIYHYLLIYMCVIVNMFTTKVSSKNIKTAIPPQHPTSPRLCSGPFQNIPSRQGKGPHCIRSSPRKDRSGLPRTDLKNPLDLHG